jgi:hypothetical protein
MVLLAFCPLARSQQSPGGPTPGPTPYPVPTNPPPAVVIFAPTNGSVFFAPADVFIDVLAVGGTNQVTLVQFYANGGLIGSITNPVVPPGALPPIRLTYPLVWSNVVVGPYALTASATFESGNSLTSAPVNIMVETPPPPTNPIVNIIYPTNGSTFFAPANIPLDAVAYDIGGIVKTVEFFENGTSIGIATNNPISATPVNLFHLNWPSVPIGAYAVTAVATSGAGLTSTSAPVNIKVIQAPSNAPPVVVINTPTNGQSFTAPADVLISANVSDPDALVNVIAFYAGTNLINIRVVDPFPGETNTAPFDVSFLWQDVPAGNYALTVVASDTHGLSGTSAPVNIAVIGSTNPVPPEVSIVTTDPIAVEGTNCCFVRPVSVFTNFCTGTNTATFLVRRRGDTNSDLTVGYSIGGTASNGVDYITLPGTVTIPAGQRFALITVYPLEDVDATAIPYSTVVLALNPPPPPVSNAPPAYTLGWPRKAAAIILEECFLPVPVAGPLADSCFRVAWPAANGQNYCIQLSTDLQNWTPVCTNTVVKGSIQFVDPEASDMPNRFYRSVPIAGPLIY